MSDTATSTDINQKLEELWKEVTERMQEIRTLQKEQAGEIVEDYELQGREGPVRLSEIFGDKDEMILIHNMGKGCSYCTLWADGFNGVTHHLEDRVAFGLVSPDSPEVQKEFGDGRGWKFRMYSAQGSSFTRDLGFETDHEGKPWVLPGVSAFRREADGTIRRTAYDFFGPGDVYSGLWHLLDLLPEGPNGWHPRMAYS